MIKFEISLGPRLGRVKVISPPKVAMNFSSRDLAEVIMDLTRQQNADSLGFTTGLSSDRCREILEIRDKLLDILE